MALEIRYWKQLERHELSARYEDIKGKAWEEFKANLKEHGIVRNRPITLYEGKVIDGWQLQRACVENDGPKPVYVELKLSKGMTVEEYVETVNDMRRHETQERAMQRRSERIERVAAARAEGQTQAAIAEAEGVSKKTIQDDIAEAVGKGLPTEPPDGKVTGEDNKSYPSTKTSSRTLCDRCARVGAVKDCPVCKELNKKPDKTKSTKPEKEALKDAFGNEVPKRCRDAWADPWIQDAFDILATSQEKILKARLADGMNKRKKHYPFFDAKEFIEGVRFMQDYMDKLIDHLKTKRPAGVCPSCSGPGCVDCHQSGLVPRSDYKELAKKAKAG